MNNLSTGFKFLSYLCLALEHLLKRETWKKTETDRIIKIKLQTDIKYELKQTRVVQTSKDAGLNRPDQELFCSPSVQNVLAAPSQNYRPASVETKLIMITCCKL